MSREEHTDVYSNPADEYYPGLRERSRPGQAPKEEVYDNTTDAYGNRVTDKPANRAMLASQRRRIEHEAKVKRAAEEREQLSQKQKQKKQMQKVRGQSPKSSSGLLWSYLPLILFLPLISSFLTQTYSFGLSPYFLPPLRRFWAETPLNPFKSEMREFTPLQLARYDGRDDRPVYLAIDGVVFDVSDNRRVYGKGGSYNMMAGRDASRAFTTGCFETHLTHDTRGLIEAELASLKHWKSFFANHEKYRKVGTIKNPILLPSDPIPPPCRVAEPDVDITPNARASSHEGSDSAAHAHGSGHEHGHGLEQHAPGEEAAKHGKAKPGPVHQ